MTVVQCSLTSPHPQIQCGDNVPRSFYLHNQVRTHYEHTVTVARGSFVRVENEILFPGYVLR